MNKDIYTYQRQKILENTSKQSWDRDLAPDSLPPQKIHGTHCLEQANARIRGPQLLLSRQNHSNRKNGRLSKTQQNLFTRFTVKNT